MLQDRRRIDATPSISPTRVLVVDDDDNFRTFVTTLLQRLGWDVEAARDGEEGLTKLASGRFDIVLCDLNMPKVDGFDLIARARTSPSSANVYAVMMTVHTELESRVAALSRGFDDFLSKSCSDVEVVATMTAARRMLTRQLAFASQLRTWRDIATRDELTSVATRRTFFEQATADLETAGSIAIALFDLDDFKAVNDTLGHLVGDRVLRDVGALLLSFTRHDDLVARYGGDEFVMLMANTPVDDATMVAERLGADIRKLQWSIGDGEPFSISATIGVGHSLLLEHPTIERIIDAADRHLYAKKWLRKHPSRTREECYEYPLAGVTSNLIQLVEKRPEAGTDQVRGSVGENLKLKIEN